MSLILTPSDHGFWETLHSAPPIGEKVSPFYVVDHQSLTLRNASENEFVDYYQGGELDEVDSFWEEYEDDDLVLI